MNLHDLHQLKRQAKELLEAFRAGGADAKAKVGAHLRGADPATFALHDAQFVLARSYGFESWPKLKAHVDGVTVSRLCEAAETGDLAAAADMLGRRPEIVNLEWPGHGEQRALHSAVLRRDVAMVRLLMHHGADAHRGIWPNRDATSAFTIAMERGYTEIVAAIRQGEREQRNRAEPVPDLQEILDGPAEEVIARLRANPGVAGSVDPKGWAALHYAAGMLAEDVVRWLLQHGADPNQRGHDGWTPLEAAAAGWRCHSTERFPRVATLLIEAGAKLTALPAVALGDAAWIRARHSEGALRNETSTDLFVSLGGLLTAAVRHDRPEMLALLLEFELDPDERGRVEGLEDVVYSQGLPLYTCAQHGKLRMAEMLLERGADPNAPVFAAGSAYYVAHRRGESAMIQLLERHGGSLDAASVGYLRQTELARKMLGGEIDPHLENGTFSGETVAEQLLWSGASGGDPEIVRMALQRIDWPRDDRRWFWMLWRPLPGHSDRPEAEHALYRDCFRMILERCDPNLRAEHFGQSMLHEVIARDHGEGLGLASLLLDAGARTDVRDRLLYSTPLGWACRWGRTELVRLLLARGADPVEGDAEPWATPRAWAEKMGHSAVLALLPCGAL